jgi:hypothetical protein
MLDVFVVKTSSKNKKSDLLLSSFDFTKCDFYFTDNIEVINQIPKTNPWYFVIYDNEILSVDLKAAIPKIFQHGSDPFYIMYRISLNEEGIDTSKMSTAPRLFECDVVLKNNNLNPDCGIRLDKGNHILDGFIYGLD